MFDLALSINKIAFSIGGLDIAWYGIIVTSGIVLGLFTFLYMCRQQNIDEDFSLSMFLVTVIFAVAFCRIFYVVPRIGTTYTTFKEAINIREGGMTIVGGIFGGVLAITLITLVSRKYHFVKLTDTAVMPVMVGQIIGRWGNYMNQELFGLQITNESFQHFPFAVYIENPASHYSGYEPGWYCALFFYEGVLNFIGLAVLMYVYHKYKNKIKPGTITLGYLIWYGLVRGSLEFLKIDHVTLGNTGIGTIQIICYVMAAICIVLLVLLYTNKIYFESKSFQTVIDKRWDEIKAKMEIDANKRREIVDKVADTTVDTTNAQNSEVTENTVANDKIEDASKTSNKE